MLWSLRLSLFLFIKNVNCDQAVFETAKNITDFLGAKCEFGGFFILYKNILDILAVF
jgi:hypothetical protein